MGDILKWAQFALQILPVILQAIQAVEAAIGSGNGPVKKALIMGSLPADLDPSEKSLVSGMIDASVTAMNQAGTLKKAA